MNDSNGLVLIDADEVKAKIGLRSDSRLYELMKCDPAFPKPIKGSKRYSRFVLREVNAWIEKQIQERDARLAA